MRKPATEEELYYPSSENKGAEAADLRLCFVGFPLRRLECHRD